MRERVERDAASISKAVVEAPAHVPPSALESSDVAVLPVAMRARPRGRRIGAYVAVVGAVVAAALGGAALGRGGRSTAAAEAREEGAPALPPPAAPPSAPAPLPAPEVATAPGTTASASPPRPSLPARAVRSPPPQDCVTVGADGIKRWNPRCK
jgi:hypothetical protein